jgi:winged helix domain-containing protein
MEADNLVEQRLEALRGVLEEDPIAWPGERLGLTPTEERILWLLVAHELCPEVRMRLRSLATEHASEPTRELLCRLVYRSTSNRLAWRELGEACALQRLGLIERTDTGPDAAYRQTLKASRRVLAVVHGERELDASLADIARIVADDPPALEIDAAIVERVRGLVRATDAMVVVHGGAGTGRRSLLVALARERGLRVLAVDARAIAGEPAAAERQLRAIARECALLGLTPLVTSLDALGASESAPDRLAMFDRELAGGLALATSSRAIARRWQRDVTFVELPRPTGRQRSLSGRAQFRRPTPTCWLRCTRSRPR